LRGKVGHLLEVAGGGGDDVAEGEVRERRLHRVRIHLRRLLLMLLLAPASPSSARCRRTGSPDLLWFREEEERSEVS